MLLIVILGLMAKLMSVYGDCDIGTELVNDFDLNKFSGPLPWYAKLHKSNDVEGKFDCANSIFASPEGNRSSITTHVYDIREQRHTITYGNITNWNSTGYFDISHQVSNWSGRFYIIAIDYDRYFITKFCPLNSNEGSVYVAFRHSHPDKGTVEEVMKVMKDKNIDGSQLVELNVDHCQQA